MKINKTKFWWGMVGLVVIVLGGVNVYLFLLKRTMNDFILGEVEMSNKMMANLEKIRAFWDNPQQAN